MKKSINLLLLLVGSLSVIAQESQSVSDYIKILGYGVGNQTKETEISFEEAKKRELHCVPAQFTACGLILGNGKTLDKVTAKYDFKEHILLIDHEGKVLVAAPNMISEIQFKSRFENEYGNIKLINVSQLGRTFGRRGFYEVLTEENDNRLVCHRELEVVKPSYNETLDIGDRDSTYLTNKDYLVFYNQKAYKLGNFKSKTLSQFDEKEGDLKAYIKKEKLKFKEEEDLIRFAKYLWSL